MHPNAYLRTFWRLELRPEVFVAMPFSDDLRDRFERVYEPAIREIAVGGVQLQPRRVDLSKSGDSILTEIVDGIAHAQLVLADISTVGTDATGRHYRNGNVMYEVGIALACRTPPEVILVRDDNQSLLFDVSTIPCRRVDFSDTSRACHSIRDELNQRLLERTHLHDARVAITAAQLSPPELAVIEDAGNRPIGLGWGYSKDNENLISSVSAFPRLLDKQMIRCMAIAEDGQPMFTWTKLGKAVISFLSVGFPRGGKWDVKQKSSGDGKAGE